jgi:hypothetical protein
MTPQFLLGHIDDLELNVHTSRQLLPLDAPVETA